MHTLMTFLCLLMTVMFTAAASAQDDAPQKQDRGNRRAEMRQKMLQEFDADGDGKLSDEERGKAREAMQSRRGRNAQGDQKGKQPGKQPRQQARGQGPRGSGGPPDPGKLFDKFDANKDGQLSRAEFMKLSEEMRPPRRPGAAGDRPGGPRPEGPPRDGRRVQRQRPLQNPGDASEGPRARPAGHRLVDEDAPRDRAARGGDRDRRGPEGRGPEGWQPPSPEQIFDYFDENQDDQLSRAEFMKLADRMRQMHDRMPGPPPERGARDDRGPRRGPPEADGPPRPRRPERPKLESESDARPKGSAEDDSV